MARGPTRVEREGSSCACLRSSPGCFHGWRSAVFGGALIWPFLGLIFLPFTTLMYTLLYLPGGLTGFDWVWVGIAFALDIGHYGYSAYGNRNQIPGYTGS